MSVPILELSDVSKGYGGLRPLRIEHLAVRAGEQVAILGLDQVTAEVFINLVTGASLPDRGEVRAFGRSTAAIADSAGWLAVVDRFGIVSERAVLLDALSVIQNLAMPFTLDVEPPPGEIRERAAALAREVELAESTWTRPVGDLDRLGRARLRLARALALDPAIMLLEHPTSDLPRPEVARLGHQVRALGERRGAAVIVLTADREFAAASAAHVLAHQPSTGATTEARGWRRWLG